jgi:hypothetical protein
MRKSMHEHVRDGDITPKHGGATYEALAQEALVREQRSTTVERQRLQRQPRRLSMAPAGIMRMRGKR